MKKELADLRECLLNGKNEDANRPLAYSFFRGLLGKKFRVESDASGADGYIEGKLLVELKTESKDWLKGLYQGLHYQKLGLSFPNICVLSNRFVGLWKVSGLPQEALKLVAEADSQRSPNEIGRINANKTCKAIAGKILHANTYLIRRDDFGPLFPKDTAAVIRGFVYALQHLDDARIQINPHNFIDHIDLLRRFFDRPLDAIHCFYAIVSYWSVTSKVAVVGDTDQLVVVDASRDRTSDMIEVRRRHQAEFKRFIESHYIFTNEGSGITSDYYFSRFDEVITRLNSNYAIQHGILFTDHNLSKFAMWFVHQRFEKNLSEKYIVFDPAGGSGNLITSLDWRGHLKHKIVSELQPDLLKVIERRMRVHEEHAGRYTIIPKTAENRGLNFLDKSCSSYITELEQTLGEGGLKIDKPLAFLLNPPYKNTDENVAAREQVEAEYVIDPTILELTGDDAGKERYLAFLGQILRFAEHQTSEHPDFEPLLMIFTPTSWLVPRPTYVAFRKEFDRRFRFVNGFLIRSNEFFKTRGKWPLAFTIWQYHWTEKGNKKKVKLWDYTHLKRSDLAAINWSARIGEIDKTTKSLIRGRSTIEFSGKGKTIKEWSRQRRYDFTRSPTQQERREGLLYGGLPKDDPRRQNKKTYGVTNSEHIGFMDDCTPVRIRPITGDVRFADNNTEKRIWFRLDNEFKGINRAKIFSGPADNRSYCAYDLTSAEKMFTWFAIAKSSAGRYPVWANQLDIWAPRIPKAAEKEFYSLCFAFGLAENRCVVTRFEADNPVIGTPEAFVENPLSANNPDSFWNTTLDEYIVDDPAIAKNLVNAIKGFYKYWAQEYCRQSPFMNVGLKDEPYFKYFQYADFLTANSGLIQIHKFAEVNDKVDLLQQLEDISGYARKVRDEIYRLLIEDLRYFQ